MTLEYIRKTYGVPAKRGARVRDDMGREGTITGTRGPYLEVRIDGYVFPFSYHPGTLVYLDKEAT